MKLTDFNLQQLRAELSPEQIIKLFSGLTNEEATYLQYTWPFWARREQLPPTDEDWLTWLILAGRGFGKTRSGAEWVIDLVQNKGYRRLALVAEDAGDARDVMVEGESGILNSCWKVILTGAIRYSHRGYN